MRQRFEKLLKMKFNCINQRNIFQRCQKSFRENEIPDSLKELSKKNFCARSNN